jgi:hypothetical protein
MNNKMTNADSPTLHRHWLSDAIGSAWKLAKFGVQPASGIDVELGALTAPHLAVLVYKRAKYAASADEARWQSELHHFVERTVIPQLAEDPALAGLDSNRLASSVDAIVAAEQRRLTALESDPLPSTSRFEDTSWAT